VNAGTYFEFDAAGNYCPASLYAASKRAFADLLEEACLHRGIGGITLIIFDVYGPADWRGKLLPALIAASKTSTPVKMSPGEQLLDLVHVEDVARAFEIAARQTRVGRHERFGIDSGHRQSLRAVVETLEAGLGRAIPAQFGALAYRSNQIMSPVANLPRLSGWSGRPFQASVVSTLE
jgi:nucleoside-diphosphate-sugar epimerase